MSFFLPHDLLKLETLNDLEGDTPAPDWVADSLATAPWVVVRRAMAPTGQVAVGVRGRERHQRWGARLPIKAVAECWRPEAVVERLAMLPPARAAVVPALAAIPDLMAALAARGLVGGPTGSTGFELASGRPTATAASDLDAMVRAPKLLERALAVDLVQALAVLAVRCDVVLETPAGAIALAEYARAPGPVAARGPHGPRLVADPWAKDEELGA
ncbi:MAG: malonate decarboxylase holo-ACP synthase [Azospirillaceae bacterium]|nr:malonate decarboxylase holo-ACP synthase [Azospirillaceae bacterium]